MKKLLLILASIITLNNFSQDNIEVSVNDLIKGTLISSAEKSKTNLIILIAGSGPTDRDGNQATMKNNSLKFLAEGIADTRNDVFRFDKRMFALAKSRKLDEKTLSFEDMILDVNEVIKYFKANYKYKKIIIAGHSEGSLIGMICANGNADAYISISGPGRPADEIVEEQIAKQAPAMKDEVHNNFALLKKGQTFENKNFLLASLFRESVQPYLISWIKYNPQVEIKKLKIPTLILNGTKDIQVSVNEAELLKKMKPDAQLEIIENMNHVLKEIKGDDKEGMAAYSNPDLPIIKTVIEKIKSFISKL